MWNWGRFKGDPACLKWSRRDLEILEAVLPLVPGRVCAVQAGGNVGIFPKRLAEVFRTVYTFEPAFALFNALVQNVPETNVIKMQAALGAEHQLISVSQRRRDSSGRADHGGLTHVNGNGVIPTLKIDDLALNSCDLIYLDIEGFEYYALQGAEITIKSHRPVIVVEINQGIQFYGHDAQELRDLIISHGYSKVFKMHSDEIFIPL